MIPVYLISDLSNCLPSKHDALSDYLKAIPAVTVAVVNLEYPGMIMPHMVKIY